MNNTVTVGMSAWFDPPPILPTNTHDIHMVSACRHVFITTLNFLFENFEWTILLLSACQHVGMYSCPIHCRHTLFTFMRRSVIRVVGCFAHTPDILPDFQMKHMILSACRHVGMSAWVDPPPILPTNTHDIYMVSACRHIFIKTPYFFFSTKY